MLTVILIAWKGDCIMELGAIISEKRKQAGLTIDELAAKSGVPKGTLNKIINGYTRDPQIETVKSIARALNCTLEDFDDSPRVRTLSQEEYLLIQQYRLLDSIGQEIVQFIIKKELERAEKLGIAKPNVPTITFAELYQNHNP
ncbi:MAG: XRE family transcriptional regulator [Subdoligranulum sp.]|nr:XRE family transcriptional regulator [Subdoligranulum sp.]